MIKSVAWAVATALLMGCAGSGTTLKPAPLKKIASPEVRGVEVWDRRVGPSGLLTGLRPVVSGDQIFAGDRKGVITVLSLDGKVQWRKRTAHRFTAGPGVAGDLLVFGTRDGAVVAFGRQDGSPVWQTPVSSEVLSAPVIDGELVFARAGDGRIYGLNVADGSRVWTQDRAVPALSLRGTAPLLVGVGAVYAGMDNGRVIALNRSDGEPMWEETVSIPSGRSEVDRIVDVDADLLLVDSILYASSYAGDMVAINAYNGMPQWRRALGSYAGMDQDSNCIYVTDNESVVWCLDPASGAALWKQDKLKYRGLTAPASFKGNVVVADYQGYVHWLSAVTGQIIGRSRAATDPVRMPPQVVDGRLLVIDEDGGINVLDSRPYAG